MITIGNKEVVFQTTVLLRPNDVATITTPDACGVSFKLVTGAIGVVPSSASDIRREIVGDEITFDQPFLPNKITLSSHDDVTHDGREMGVCIASQGVGDYTVVHLQCYIRH